MATDVQNAWVTRVLGLDSALATAKPNPDAVARLTAAIRQLEALKAEGAPELPALFAAVTAARAAIATPEAGAQLNALEAAIARAQSAARGRAAKPPTPAASPGLSCCCAGGGRRARPSPPSARSAKPSSRFPRSAPIRALTKPAPPSPCCPC